jgi:DNA-binding transcriptional MerR regulator
VLTIGQLAGYAGVSTKTVRVYHAKGLLPEPQRDASGYRRYTAQNAIDLIKIRTLVEAGVPLARIRDLKAAPDEEFRRALRQVDLNLTARIRQLRQAQHRLRRLASGDTPMLPPEVSRHLVRLSDLGFSPRWVAMETDLWILVFATHADTAVELFQDQAQSLDDPALRQIYLDYDRSHDLDPRDPRLDDLAARIVAATRDRYGGADLPGQSVDSDMPALIQASVNASSPAWRRIDTLVRDRLRM